MGAVIWGLISLRLVQVLHHLLLIVLCLQSLDQVLLLQEFRVGYYPLKDLKLRQQGRPIRVAFLREILDGHYEILEIMPLRAVQNNLRQDVGELLCVLEVAT